MRALHTLSASLLLFTAQAQWPTAPNAPLVVCNDASDQRDFRVAADGTGGWYVLWIDNRLANDRYAVFGQRLDAQGNLLWEPNGRLVQEVPGRSLNMYAISRLSNGNLFMAYISGPAALNSGDTVRAMAYDTEGAPVWAEPALLAYPGPLPGGGTSGGNYYPRAVPVLNGVFVGWGTNPMGASDYVHIARILNDGTNMMPTQGVEVASLNNSIVTGPWTMRHDLAGGLLLEERWGNGAGAPLYAMRVDSMGTPLWPANLVVSANSGGLAYEWSSAMAPNARMNSVWANGYDLRMAIYDTTGVLFNPTAPIPVCLQADVQENPFVVQSAAETAVFWADNRSALGGGRQVFMQRFDATGAPLLAADGVLAMQCNGNTNGFPRAIAAENGSHIVVMAAPFAGGGATPGFRAGRITPTGTNLWADTVRFCDAALNPDHASGWSVSSDNDGGAVAVWLHPGGNTIYAARLDRNGRMGDFTSVPELDRYELRVHPNPATDRIIFTMDPGDRPAELRLFDSQGRLARTTISPNGSLDIRDLDNGPYLLQVRTKDGVRTARFIKNQLP